MRTAKHNWFGIVFILTILLGWVAVEYFFSPKPEPAVAQDTLDELQKQSVLILIEMNKLLLSLAILIIGGLGALLLGKYKNIKLGPSSARLAIASSSLFAIFSVYFGYILYDRMVEMLSNHIFDPTNSLIEYPRRFQYYCLWFSVILFVVYLLQAISLGEQLEESSIAKMEDKRDEARN